MSGERPPHEQGAGVLRFTSFGTGEGIDGGRLTSRSLPPAGRLGDAALPCGQGALRVCVFDAVCPVGAKALPSVARRILVGSRGKVICGAVCP